MRARSPKRAAQERIYMKKRAEWFAEPRPCEFPGCGRVATEIHHRRGRVGALLTDERYWSAMCSEDHRWATVNPARAYELGISERRVGGAA